LVAGVPACGDLRPAPELDRLRYPTGIAVAPDGTFALVSNGNWDNEEADGTVVMLDLVALHQRIDAGDCPAGEDDGVPHCAVAPLLDPAVTIRPGTGLGNLVIDQPGGPDGPLRAMLPVRSPASVTWFDVAGGTLDCGQGDNGTCDDEHRVRVGPNDESLRLPNEPGRIELDDQGFRFLYVPHLAGGNMSLVALDGDRGPALANVQTEFFLPRPDETEEFAGGFGVAQRACDPADPSTASRDCERPLLYVSQRYFPGMRAFTVAPGLELILPGGPVTISALAPELVQSRPYMGDMAFEDPATGESLLAVQTTPSALVRLDMRLEDGSPRAAVTDTVALCQNPNVLAIDRLVSEAGVMEPGLALVACYSDGALAVVDLATFRVVASVDVGAGAQDIAIDPARRIAYVTSTLADHISVVSLDRGRADYLTVRAVIGN
jgi:hypothetical protein